MHFLNRFNRIKINLLLDIALAILFAVEMEEHFTGLRNHELIGLFIGALFIFHILLHWNWVITITRRFFRPLLHESRMNYVLNLALLMDMAVVIITGILISRTLGLNLSSALGASFNAQRIHILASQLSLIIVGLHVAVHWKWIVAHSKKYLFGFRLPKLNRQSVSTSTVLQ